MARCLCSPLEFFTLTPCRNEGKVLLRALLEHRDLLERPRGSLGLLPIRMVAQSGRDVAEVRLVVRPEEKSGPLLGPTGRSGEKLRFHHAVLVMAPLRPRIWKQDEDLCEPRSLGHRSEEVVRISANEMQIFEPGPCALALRARYPVRHDVHAYAVLARMRLRIGREEVAMATSHLPDEARRRPDDPRND